MDKQHAINYLRSSGYSDEQIDVIKRAFEVDILGDIREKLFERFMMNTTDYPIFTGSYYKDGKMAGLSDAYHDCFNIVDKYYMAAKEGDKNGISGICENEK